MARGDRRHLVTFQNPGPAGTWTDLVPSTWHVSLAQLTGDDIGVFIEPEAGTPISSASYAVRGDFHPGVTTKTRMLLGAQTFAITSVENIEMRGIDMECRAVPLVMWMPIQATLSIQGIAELKDALAKLPQELKGQATQIVLDTAYAAADDVRSQYPTGPGTSKNGRKIPPGQLKAGVRVFPKEVGPFAVAAQVRSTSPHAWWHENGHKLKPRETKRTKASRGTMFGVKGIPRPVFIPTMIRHRRWMYQKLAVLLESVGLLVKHDEAA